MMGARFLTLLAACAVLVGGCTASQTPTTSGIETSGLATTSSADSGDGFDEFVEESFLALLARDPETATAYGLGETLGVNNQLNDRSAEYADSTLGLAEETLARLRAFDQATLDADQSLTRDVFEWHLEREIESHEFRYHDWPVHFLVTSYNQGLLGLFTQIHPLTNRNQIEAYLDRLDQVDTQVEQVIQHLETAVEMGITPPKYVIDITVNQLRGQAEPPERNAILNSFRERIEQLGLNDPTVADYTARAEEILEATFLPAWTALADYLESLGTTGGDDIGLGRLPDGDRFYRYLLALYTSTELGPEEIHDLGLREADRIIDEMNLLGRVAGFETTDLGELRKRFAAEAGFVDSPEVVDTYARLIDDATIRFEPYFSHIPSSPLQVINDPGPVAFYVGPPLDASRPGSFHAGTGGGRVPRYTMKSLAHHEAVPGHHFQIALAQESEELPLIQRLVATTGHVEGWALYAERLASDIGAYQDDPASDFGRLDFELLRAARLIVDTGIHHLGWSRSEAIEEMQRVMGGPEYNEEVDRYVVYPAQATAYMVGMLRILELREAMGVDMGNPADLAAFHDSIIGNGNVPLPVLDN